MLRVVFPFKTLKPTVLAERQILQLAAHIENIKIKLLAHNQILLCIKSIESKPDNYLLLYREYAGVL